VTTSKKGENRIREGEGRGRIEYTAGPKNWTHSNEKQYVAGKDGQEMHQMANAHFLGGAPSGIVVRRPEQTCSNENVRTGRQVKPPCKKITILHNRDSKGGTIA